MRPAEAWAASGAMALTGPFDGPPLVPPDGVIERVRALGDPFGVDVPALLAERAAAGGLTRRGSTSCGGAARLLTAAGGEVVAVNLPRDDDLELVPAWLGAEAADDPWAAVEDAVPRWDAVELVGRGAMLGLPVAMAGEVAAPAGGPVRVERVGEAPPLGRPPVVVDLSSLWAGPLCTRLLADAGADVVKVESRHRPDGARRGPRAFFDRLHAGKRSVVVEWTAEALGPLLASADVVVTASRPRALAQLGVDLEAMVGGRGEAGPRVWVAITGYGRRVDRVAFGDDAGVAGGLVAGGGDGRPPCFVADAVADPLTGVAAAGAVQRCLADGGRWIVDAAMAGVAAWVAGDDRDRMWGDFRGSGPEKPHRFERGTVAGQNRR